jgi:hypothetical protein
VVGLSRLVAAKANSCRGITEAVLAARGPDLDSEGTARAVPLTCTSKGPDMSSDPNVTLLVEQEVDMVARNNLDRQAQ